MPKTETIANANGIMIDGVYEDINDLVVRNRRAIDAQVGTIVSHGRSIGWDQHPHESDDERAF